MTSNAATINGMTLAIGQGRDPIYTPDRVYVRLTMPAAPRVFKMVLGWKDRNDRGSGDGNQRIEGS